MSEMTEAALRWAERNRAATRDEVVAMASECLRLRARVAELEAERADLDKILSRRDALLRGVADGLRGPAPDGLVWGDHGDLPELAARMRAAGSRGEQ